MNEYKLKTGVMIYRKNYIITDIRYATTEQEVKVSFNKRILQYFDCNVVIYTKPIQVELTRDEIKNYIVDTKFNDFKATRN